MAKAPSPVRLQSSLMDSARLSGEILHRSAAEQVEYWASLGQLVDAIVTPVDLIKLQAGLMNFKLEEVPAVTIDPDSLFVELEQKKQSGSLKAGIGGNNIRYQSSSSHPGCLEQVHPNGHKVAGRFTDGEFHPLENKPEVYGTGLGDKLKG